MIGAFVKPTDESTQKGAQGVSKAPASNDAASHPDATTPVTPAKAPGDPSRSFPLQFESISPGFMNGMQIPEQTNSAPPNYDEQKRDKACHASLRGATSTFPNPTVPKQQWRKKDAVTADQSNINAQEWQTQSSRLARGPSLSSLGRRLQPNGFAPRGSNVLPSHNYQMGNFRGIFHPLRGYANQGRDLRLDIGYGGNVQGFRPGPGGNYGVLRNPRAQTPTQHAMGILSGPMQSPSPQGNIQRNNIDSDRWQRSTSFHKGLIPSPQTPLQVMHKAERNYEVGKITDEEQAKQRQLKGIINKLTPQNFEKLFEQVKQVNIDNAGTLSCVVDQIFEKALMKPTFCEMYANLCCCLAVELPDFNEDNEKITFKRLLLNKCQEEFERDQIEQEETNRAVEEGEAKQTEEEREEKRIKGRRRRLGNIQLIGELYKKRMLTERIMHECIQMLLGEYQNPDEEDVEALCKLMSTIGVMIDHPKAKAHMDAYFDMMYKLSNNMKLSSRVRFLLKDSIDLRKNKWQQRRKVDGPKKIDEVHRDAAQERQAQSSRLARGPSFSSSGRRGQLLPSPSSQMGNFHGLSQPLRGYANQDARYEERHAFETRPLSVPLRPVGDDYITLGPQGGFARGMSSRGQPSIQTLPKADMPSPADSRRATAGPNGYSSVSERTGFGSREDLASRYPPERFVPPSAYENSGQQVRNMNFMNMDTRNVDRTFDRPPPTSSPTRGRGPSLPQTQTQVLPEERLREKSIEAIKEFYSAKDEKEVAMCIMELNAPSFYPSMISIWVNDSFERKDLERDLLAKLLVNLAKSHDAMLNQDQLVKGFESVLESLEDTVTDAPKAAEFLGRILARIVLESAIPYVDVWRLIYEGGEEQGRLVEVGLAAEVVGVILEIIESEKGDPFLTEMCASSNLRVENFRPPGSKKAWRMDTRNVDRTFDRPPPTSSPTRGRGPSLPQTQTQVLPEERLREKSIEAIKEFYSAKDEKEVAMCIMELNAPSFYPSMISIWVNDSFERKDLERDLLAKLLVNLAKSHDAVLNQDQLVKGFESVLESLEDTVTDAPKAAEFLGRILARIVLESAIPYVDVWRLIYEGGEEQGRLVEVGLAAEVVGVILEIIESEKGDPFLTEMCASSNLRVENFRPPGSKKAWRIDKFI